MKKFLIFLSIIIILGLGVFFTLSYFQANNQTKGTLRFKVHPLESIVKINNKTYQDSRGIFDINPVSYTHLSSKRILNTNSENTLVVKFSSSTTVAAPVCAYS